MQHISKGRFLRQDQEEEGYDKREKKIRRKKNLLGEEKKGVLWKSAKSTTGDFSSFFLRKELSRVNEVRNQRRSYVGDGCHLAGCLGRTGFWNIFFL